MNLQIAKKILTLSLLMPSLVLAQATSAMNLALDTKSIQDLGNDDARVNLMAELLKQYPALKTNSRLEISAVRLEARAGIGGAQVFLRVNNNYVDGESVETNSNLANTADTNFKKIELKNIDRSQLTEASLVLQSASNIRIRNLQVIMGTPEEPAIIGKYADDQVTQIGGGVADGQVDLDERTPTTPEQLAAVYEKFYGDILDVTANQEPVNPVVTPTPAPRPPQTVRTSSSDCLVTTRGPVICIGGVITDRYEGNGVIEQIIFNLRGSQVLVRYNSGRYSYAALNGLSIVDTGAGSYGNSLRAESCMRNYRNENLCVGASVTNTYRDSLRVKDVIQYRANSFLVVTDAYGRDMVASVGDLYLVQAAQPQRPTYNPQPQPSRPVQTQPQQPQAVSRCVFNKQGRPVCVGETVYTSTGLRATVIDVKENKVLADKVTVRLETGRTETLTVDKVFKR